MLPVNEDNKMVSPPIMLLHILTDYKLAEWPANQKVHVFNCDGIFVPSIQGQVYHHDTCIQ